MGTAKLVEQNFCALGLAQIAPVRHLDQEAEAVSEGRIQRLRPEILLFARARLALTFRVDTPWETLSSSFPTRVTRLRGVIAAAISVKREVMVSSWSEKQPN